MGESFEPGQLAILVSSLTQEKMISERSNTESTCLVRQHLAEGAFSNEALYSDQSD
jgi:hypothetical protein